MSADERKMFCDSSNSDCLPKTRVKSEQIKDPGMTNHNSTLTLTVPHALIRQHTGVAHCLHTLTVVMFEETRVMCDILQLLWIMSQ